MHFLFEFAFFYFLTMEISSAIKKVYNHPLLQEEELATLESKHSSIKLEKGEFLMHEGKVADSYFIIQSGLVRSFAHDNNLKEVTTGFFVPGEIAIVPISFFKGVPSQENLQAITSCTALCISKQEFNQLFVSMEGLVAWGREWFAEQVFFFKQRSLDLALLSASERYEKMFSMYPEVVKNAPLKYIASYLGITDTSLSRIRKNTDL